MFALKSGKFALRNCGRLASNARSFASITKFSKQHEWVTYDTDSLEATVGITDFAQSELGDVVYVELPQVGDSFNVEEAFANIESVKSVSDIYAPGSGEVTEVNEELEDAPELINESAEEKGWLAKFKLTSIDELTDDLISKEEYDAFVAESKEE
eukprot:CAMPEP_0115015954 /NCGR_PEP_ID=MMETSP0216-20121206/27106_1 /TAXON_ID=223996 /ORGANISM="Protocruzia adherens, Strain Boccale" /LENGTH=154 /DNA_ID=CAMNT_0002386233 /DNA_START=39 /DNA_END=503 /DNA_ORIENTATION=-